MVDTFGTVPASTRSKPTPFEVNVPQEQLDEFKTLLKLSKLGPETYENKKEDGQYGITRYWLAKAKAEWETFDWYYTTCFSRVLSRMLLTKTAGAKQNLA